MVATTATATALSCNTITESCRTKKKAKPGEGIREEEGGREGARTWTSIAPEAATGPTGAIRARAHNNAAGASNGLIVLESTVAHRNGSIEDNEPVWWVGRGKVKLALQRVVGNIRNGEIRVRATKSCRSASASAVKLIVGTVASKLVEHEGRWEAKLAHAQ